MGACVFFNLSTEQLREVLAFVERQGRGEVVERIAGVDGEPEPIISEADPVLESNIKMTLGDVETGTVEMPLTVETTTKPKRGSKKTVKGSEETQAATVTPPPPPVSGISPAPAEAPVAADPIQVFGNVTPPPPAASTPAPVTPPPPPATPPADGKAIISEFMTATIESIRAQRMTHEQVMVLLREHGINNFGELESNVDKIPALRAALK